MRSRGETLVLNLIFYTRSQMRKSVDLTRDKILKYSNRDKIKKKYRYSLFVHHGRKYNTFKSSRFIYIDLMIQYNSYFHGEYIQNRCKKSVYLNREWYLYIQIL